MISPITLVFALACGALASPVSTREDAPTGSSIEKRVTHWGRGTWFQPGMGNCGKWDKDSDPIVAISLDRYQDGNGGNCDQWIKITNTANGKTAWGKTRDSCPGCAYDDLDLSPSLFQQLGSLDTGVLALKWNFESKGFNPRELPQEASGDVVEV